MESLVKKIGLLLLIVAVLTLSSIVVAIVLSFTSGTSLSSGNVAVIPIDGVISTSSGYFDQSVDPDYVRNAIDEANKDDSIKAILLDINSPGGSAVASDEIGQAVKDSKKPVVAWIRESGASGAYWIASNSQHIIANRMSITGSVGVTASYIDFAGTLARYNATYEQITGGQYKELTSPWAELTPAERAIVQAKIDKIHQFFIDEVATNRNLTKEEIANISTGEFFLGVEAKDLHLVDELGSYPQVDAYLENITGEKPVYVRYEKPKSFVEQLGLVKTSFFPLTQTSIQA